MGGATRLSDGRIEASPHSRDLARRTAQTLELVHRWGYAPTIEVLADELIGGPVHASRLAEAIMTPASGIDIQDGFVHLAGFHGLVQPSKARVESHRRRNGEARAIARVFAHDLVRSCPVVEAVGISGSVASGGYSPGDDIDIDLFARDGTKYLVYAIALGLSLKATLTHAASHGLRKLICINVIWTHGESRPFSRQDGGLAFELLHYRPLLGAGYFREVVRANEWASTYFPQLGREVAADVDRPTPNLLGQTVVWLAERPRLLGWVNRSARALTHLVYGVVQSWRGRIPEATARMQFLQQVKYPYEFFQD